MANARVFPRHSFFLWQISLTKHSSPTETGSGLRNFGNIVFIQVVSNRVSIRNDILLSIHELVQEVR